MTIVTGEGDALPEGAFYLMPWDAAWFAQWDGDWQSAAGQLNALIERNNITPVEEA